MRIHYLQHVPFEDLANIGVWAKRNSFTLSLTRLFKGENLPSVNDFDWLIVVGGPMNIYEEDRYPWLSDEKKFIGRAIAMNKIVTGICLGAQLIADVLGGKVTKNKYKEIGWLPVSLTPESEESHVFSALPKTFTAFHWHGDTFSIPPGCRRMAESEGCPNQAFEGNDGRVIGLQFHLESSQESIQRLIENCGDEIVEGSYIQKAEQMLAESGNMLEIHRIMDMLLDEIKINVLNRTS